MRAALLVALALAGCATSPPPAARAPVFDPLIFFEGRLRGAGELRVLLSRPRVVAVESRGRVGRDGALILDQRVEEQGRPARTRRWVIRRTGPGTYAGALSDAAGPVRGEVEGNRLRLRFPMDGGLAAEQWLTLSPDGRVARNRMTVSKLGVTVARLDETIRKLD